MADTAQNTDPRTADDWPLALDTTLAEAWRRLTRAVADRKAAARTLVMATYSAERGPEARVMVLRAALPSEARVEVHSDAEAAKIAELAAEPRASLLAWDDKASLQIRLRTEVAVDRGEAAAEEWARVPEDAARVYGGTPAPGTPVAAPEDHRPAAARERFAVLRCHVREIETLHLGRERHRRALFRAADGWSGQWLAP